MYRPGHNVGERLRVVNLSGHGAQDDRRCSVRQNRVVLAPVAGAKLPVANLIQPDRFSHQAGSDGGKRNSSPGRARHKPSNHCAGNAGVLRLYLYARVRTSLCHCTRDRGCSKHPAFPAPSRFRGKGISANLGRKSRRENANVHLNDGGARNFVARMERSAIRGVFDPVGNPGLRCAPSGGLRGLLRYFNDVDRSGS